MSVCMQNEMSVVTSNDQPQHIYLLSSSERTSYMSLRFAVVLLKKISKKNKQKNPKEPTKQKNP